MRNRHKPFGIIIIKRQGVPTENHSVPIVPHRRRRQPVDVVLTHADAFQVHLLAARHKPFTVVLERRHLTPRMTVLILSCRYRHQLIFVVLAGRGPILIAFKTAHHRARVRIVLVRCQFHPRIPVNLLPPAVVHQSFAVERIKRRPAIVLHRALGHLTFVVFVRRHFQLRESMDVKPRAPRHQSVFIK